MTGTTCTSKVLLEMLFTLIFSLATVIFMYFSEVLQHILKEKVMSCYEVQQRTKKVNGNYDMSFNLRVAMLPFAFEDQIRTRLDQICSDDQNTCVF